MALAEGETRRFGLVYTFAFVILLWQTVLAYAERPFRTSAEDDSQLDAMNVCVQVPVYNEDPKVLKKCLEYLFAQERLPEIIYVVDDGSNVDYTEIRNWARLRAFSSGIDLRWVRQKNSGKRHAQAQAFSDTPDADLYVTVDSDSFLDPRAIREGLKPFVRDDVMSVAGVILSANARKNFLTRVTDLWFMVGQMTDRSALSTMGSVLVNSGPLAIYRAWFVRECLPGYVSETFFGRRVEFSDDSMLTIYALQYGRAVQQPTAFAFTLMPETFDHHIRQYIRWMRGAFIRSFWRFKYLPMTGYAFWAHVLGWFQMVLGIIVFVALFVVQPFVDPSAVPYFLVIPILVGYAQALRYFTARRSDMGIGAQFLIFTLAPVASLWAFFGLRFVRYYAMLTCLRTGSWGTRTEVEVRL